MDKYKYPIVITVKYYDEFSETLETINLLTYGENLAAAIKYIEEEYCDYVESITATYAGDSGVLFKVPSEIADTLIKGNGSYSIGLKKENND